MSIEAISAVSAMKQALEAMNAMLTHMGMDEDDWNKVTFDQMRRAITALRTAIEEAEKQEPVAYTFTRRRLDGFVDRHYVWAENYEGAQGDLDFVLANKDVVKLYKHPAPSAPVQEPDYKALYEKAAQQYNELAALMDKPAPVQDLVGYFRLDRSRRWYECSPTAPGATPLYTTPPAAQRQWVGLTDVEWMNIVNKNHAWFGMQPDEVAHEVCKLTEAKLREKNTGETK